MKALANGLNRIGRMTVAIVAVLAAGAAAGCAGVGPTALSGGDPQRHELKDGTTLLVDANGGMRMFSPGGSMVHMKDGVPMETRGGEVILMKENVLWRQLRQFGTLNPKFR